LLGDCHAFQASRVTQDGAQGRPGGTQPLGWFVAVVISRTLLQGLGFFSRTMEALPQEAGLGLALLAPHTCKQEVGLTSSILGTFSHLTPLKS
jgi:hypothetical protein